MNSYSMKGAFKLLPVLGLSLLLLSGMALRSQAATHAIDLKNAAAATDEGETFYIDGGGTFDPAGGTIDASGTFNIVGTEDEPFGLPEMGGTWEATDVVSFTFSKGHQVLELTVTLHFDLGFDFPGIAVTVTDRNITMSGLPGEVFEIPAGGHAVFHMTGDKH